MKKRNILHIIMHDTGRHLECLGADVNTPNINKLAENGIIFTNYFCTAPQCGPSRASMFSGLMPHNNGVFGSTSRGFKLKEGVPYLPKILKENGYKTYIVGVGYETTSGEILELGYEKGVPSKTGFCEDAIPALLDFLSSNPPQPFFASLAVGEVHVPFPIIENPPENLKVPPFLPDELEVKKDIAGLNILVERVDRGIGEIVEILKKTKLYENTVIIFTTDHGIALPGAKATLFDPGIGIFLIIGGCDFELGKRIDCLSSNLDLTPTLLDYLGIEIPEKIQGKSLMPVIRGDKEEIREEIYAELTFHAAYDPMRCIRTRRYKYIKNFEVRPFYFPPNVDPTFSKELFKRLGYFDKIRPFEFLFDLQKDSLEKENLIDNCEYKEILKQLKEELLKWMEDTEDPLLNGPVIPPDGAIITPPFAYNSKDELQRFKRD